MKKLKTKSILACAVLASVLAGGFGLGMSRVEAAQFTYSIDGATVVAWNGTEDLKGTGAKLEVWGETGATSEKSIYGGYDGGSGTISGKTVIFNGGTVGAVYGGYSKEGSAGSSAGSSSDGNEVDINGGTVGAVYGGYGNAAHYNVVKITDGTVTNVYGGYGLEEGFVSFNTVELRGGTIEGNVYGGYAQHGAGKTLFDDNTVKISGGNLSGASVYGWGGANFNGQNNTLQIENSVTVKEIGNFDKINFVLPHSVADDTKMLTMTNAVNLTDVALNVYLNGESPEYITLIDKVVDDSFNKDNARIYTGAADSTTEATAYTITVAGSQLVLKDSVPWYKVGTEDKWLHSRTEIGSINEDGDVTVYRGATSDNAYKDINVGSHTLTVAGGDNVNSIQVTGNLTAGPLEIKDGKSLKVDGSADVGQVTLGTGATVIASGVFRANNMFSMGSNNTLGALNTVALGSNAVVSGENSVAIGNNSVATVANTVSVGRPVLTGEDKYADGTQTAIYRKIVNVAPGTADNDAVNLKQMQDAIQNAGGGTPDFIAYGTKGEGFTSPTAIGTDSLAVGNGAETRGASSNAIGNGAETSGDSSNAIGKEAKASGDHSNAIGEAANAAGYSNAIGSVAQASGNYSNAIGQGASASGDHSNAIGEAANAAGYSNAIGYNASAEGSFSNAIGNAAKADYSSSNAIGNGATVGGSSSNAIGNGATVGGSSSNAIGFYAVASGDSSNAIGSDAKADTAGAVALGAWSVANRNLNGRATVNEVVYELSVGGGTDSNSKTVYRVITNVADGTADHDAATYGQVKNAVNTLSYDSSTKKISFTTIANGTTQYLDLSSLTGGTVSLDYLAANKSSDSDDNASATGNGALALGYGANASNNNSIAIGYNSMADGSGTTVVGSSTARADYATVLGLSNEVSETGDYATVVGSQLEASGKYAVAIGSYTLANGVESMAFGRDSQTGSSAVGAMAFGSSARATGANALAVGSFSESAKRDYAVKYCKETMEKVVQYDAQIQVEPWEQALQLMAEKKGLENCLDMNTQNFIESYSEYLPNGVSFDNNVMQIIGTKVGGFDGTTASGLNAISIGASTKPKGNMASALNSIAIGTDAQATAIGSVAIGANSVASEANTVSVGSSGAERRIVNVAAGTSDHDAVNLSQMNAVQTELNGKIDMTKAQAEAAHAMLSEEIRPYITDSGLNANSSRIQNLAAGTADNDAVNLKQMQDAITLATGSMGGGGGSSTAPDYIAAGPKYAPDQAAVAYGTGSIALGYGAKVIGTSGTTDHSLAIGYNAKVTSTSAIAMGDDASAEGLRSVAIGRNAKTTANQSVALGYNSVASEENTVSVGRPALDTGTYADGENTAINRRIVNVAAGTADNDAATYGQVKGLVSATKADDGTITLHKLGDGTTTDNDIVISPSTGGGTGTGGTTYTAGNGLVLADNGTFSVSVDSSDFSFNETNKQLQLNKNGIVESGNTGIVTGGTVYTALQSYATKTELDAKQAELDNKIDATKTYTKAMINAQAEETKAELSQRISPYITDSGLSANSLQIKNLADGTADHDAVTVGQMGAAIAKITSGGQVLNLSLSDDNKLSLTSAGVAIGTVDLSGLAGGTVDAYTKTETDAKLADKANATDVYSKTEVDTALGSKANTADVYAKTDTYSKTEVDGLLAGVAPVVTEDKTALGKGSEVAKGSENATAIGSDNKVLENSKDSTAVGKGNEISGERSTAIGNGLKVHGKGSGAFGDPTIVDGDNSYSVGNNNYIKADSTYVFGSNMGTEDKPLTAENSVVLGNNSFATVIPEVDGENGVVSVGAEGTERRITNVRDGVLASDAATYGQLERTAGQLSSQIDRMGTRISKVGAGAAALAAMHPVYDPESKLTFSAGVGNYKSETAAAVGLFYRFDDRVMLNFGASVGNDNDMYNMGLNFALGRHTPKGMPTRQVMYQQLISLQTLLNEQKAENAAMHNENSTMRELLLKQSAENAAIKAQIDEQKTQHDAQIAQLLAMIEELKNR